VAHETRVKSVSTVTAASIYQIYYSEQTRGELDAGFLPLDNTANERPDWREYWPMRRFLQGVELDPQGYYGFFSPKFKSKTSLTAATVHEFIRQRDGSADVISFSPFFDQMAFPLNIMELAIVDHDCRETFARCAALVAPRFQIDQSVMSSRDTVYCNFFVAKPRFWAQWLSKCELLFEIAEDGLTPLGQALNRLVNYGAVAAPAKVFVIERVASLLLWSEKQWVFDSYDAALLPHASARLLEFATAADLLVLDALKIAHSESGAERYRTLFSQLRDNLIKRRTVGEHRAGMARDEARAPEAVGRSP
jgi:hypothetical protein